MITQKLTSLIPATQICENTILAKFGFAFHGVLHGILCISCKGIVKLNAESSLINHLKRHHPDIKRSKSAQEELTLTIEGFEIIAPEKINVDVSDIAPLAGIKVESGFVCKVRDPQSKALCMKGTTSESDMDRHLLSHAKILRPSMKSRLHSAHIQRLCTQSTKCIVVNPALSMLPANEGHISNYQAITQTLCSIPPPVAFIHENDKDRPPILKYTGFDILLAKFLQQEFGIEDLVVLSSLPGTYQKEDRLKNLADIGKRWMEGCKQQHRATNKYIQRMLGGNYPKYVW